MKIYAFPSVCTKAASIGVPGRPGQPTCPVFLSCPITDEGERVPYHEKKYRSFYKETSFHILTNKMLIKFYFFKHPKYYFHQYSFLWTILFLLLLAKV